MMVLVPPPPPPKKPGGQTGEWPLASASLAKSSGRGSSESRIFLGDSSWTTSGPRDSLALDTAGGRGEVSIPGVRRSGAREGPALAVGAGAGAGAEAGAEAEAGISASWCPHIASSLHLLAPAAALPMTDPPAAPGRSGQRRRPAAATRAGCRRRKGEGNDGEGSSRSEVQGGGGSPGIAPPQQLLGLLCPALHQQRPQLPPERQRVLRGRGGGAAGPRRCRCRAAPAGPAACSALSLLRAPRLGLQCSQGLRAAVVKQVLADQPARRPTG